MAPSSLLTPQGLWQQLQADAGLELRLKRGGEGRDADVDRAVLQKLRKDCSTTIPGLSVAALLAEDAKSPQPQISIETLLVAVLTSQRGFGMMLQEILETLVMAQARNAERALSIAFDFDAVSDPIVQTLEQFRATAERVRKVLAQTGWELPPRDARRNLFEGLRQLAPLELRNPPRGFPPASFSASGHAQLDEVLRGITDAVEEYRAWCRSLEADRSDMPNVVRHRIPEGDTRREPSLDAAYDATDYWDASVLELIDRIVQTVRTQTLDPALVAAKIAPLLANISRRQQWIDETYNALLDILDLPIWHKRYELYSVWVGTLLLRTAAKRAVNIRFYPVDGVLSFAFNATRLATYEWDGAQYDIWSELRSALVGTSKKRKKGIQPDFRVLRAQIAASHNAATHFVLECKHYLRHSLANFSQAATDYARSCPSATVFVVNHGPADADLLAAVTDDTVVQRVRFFGDVRADAPVVPAPLGEAIVHTLFPHSASVPAIDYNYSGALSLPASIRLVWDATLDDLDLSVDVFDKTGQQASGVDFRNAGDLRLPPFAKLQQDVRSGPGEEIIDITGWPYACYDIIVTDYSKSGRMRTGSVYCEIMIGPARWRFEFPTNDTDALEWQVASIDTIAQRIRPGSEEG